MVKEIERQIEKKGGSIDGSKDQNHITEFYAVSKARRRLPPVFDFLKSTDCFRPFFSEEFHGCRLFGAGILNHTENP